MTLRPNVRTVVVATLAVSVVGFSAWWKTHEGHGDSPQDDVASIDASGVRRSGSQTRESLAIARSLRETYGAHAGAVLDHPVSLEARGGSRVLAALPVAGAEGAESEVRSVGPKLVLPNDGNGSLAFEVEGRAPLRVREEGLRGSAAVVDHAVSYARENGRVFWTRGERGFEEWLDVPEGQAVRGRALARWTVEGKGLRMHEGKVLVTDEHDVPEYVVSAPLAFTKSGREVRPSLRIDGNAIVLELDANGEAVLVDPQWVAGGNLAQARGDYVSQNAVVFSNGNVLLAGGGIVGSTSYSSIAEIYNPTTNAWTATGSMATQRGRGPMIALDGTRAIWCGGFGFNASMAFADNLATCEIYDSATGTWTTTPAFPDGIGRSYMAMARLNDGRILCTAGTNGGVRTETFLYTPSTNTWSTTGALSVGRSTARAVLLNNGRVALFGGGTGSGNTNVVEVYNPATGTWSTGASLTVARARGAVVKLGDGRILLAGGTDGLGTFYNSAEICAADLSSCTAIASMSSVRQNFASAPVSSGTKVLVTGGVSDSINTNSLSTTEIFDVATGTWSAGPVMNSVRRLHAIALLNSGRVLVAGGNNGTTFLASSQVFSMNACGDGTLDAGETCDDGNTVAGDCCSPSCTYEAAGTTCRAAVDGCDVAETCNATGTCAANVFAGTTVACNDGNACTQTDRCNGSGGCAGSNPVTCTAQDQCHDAGTCNPATGSCSNPNKANGTTCNDANGCTQTDTCQNGSCSGGNSVTCAAPDQCHNAGSCQPATGVCTFPNKTNGTSCNDGDSCTLADTCQMGVCSSGTAVVCPAPDQCHTAGTCQPATGTCTNPAKSNGSSCSDGNACTQTDSCQSGTCTGASPVVCGQSDQCHDVGVCNTATGVCSDPARPNGSFCTDNNACTQSDSCQSGVCTSASTVTCTASDQCHVAGTCNTSTGLCNNPNAAAGTPCDDEDGCTTADYCAGGTCRAGDPVVCAASDDCHNAGSCNAATGLCSNPVKANGSPCSDGTLCTQTDSCQAGACVGTNPVTCSALDQCHDVGTCDPGTGVCSQPTKPDGSGCSDSNACTQSDVCQAGACASGAAVTCAALDQCHDAGVCDTTTGICSTPVKPDGTACDDGDACSQTDTCTTGACTGGNPVVCTALDQCHDVGTCDTTTGACSEPAKSDGTGCDDGDACSQTDTCVVGVCSGGNPVVCTALDQCHDVGTCDPSNGTCNSPTKTDGTTCDDGDACSQTDTCTAGACVGADEVVCSASDACHMVGVCDGSTGVCTNPPIVGDATCDGVDDDCDTEFDEDFVPTASTCGVGACASSGTTSCTSGTPGDTCVPGTPASSDATCDGIDDDCDGDVDEEGDCASIDAGFDVDAGDVDAGDSDAGEPVGDAGETDASTEVPPPAKGCTCSTAGAPIARSQLGMAFVGLAFVATRLMSRRRVVATIRR